MDQSLQINLSEVPEDETLGRDFVGLSQPVEDGMDKTASVFDIAQMIARAKSGVTAHSYKKNACPAGVDADGNINVRLDFWAWPSSPTLPHTISSNFGNVSPATIVEEYTEFSIKFDMKRAVELDFMLTEVISLIWETPCYNSKGEELQNQSLELDGLTTLRTENVLFGIARVRGRKLGAQHTLVAKLIKDEPIRPEEGTPEMIGVTPAMVEEYWGFTDVETWNGELVNEEDTINITGLSLTNLSITITAEWGEDKVNTMKLNTPQCVKDLLSMCDGDPEKSTGDADLSICHHDALASHLTVYLSSCTGKEIERRTTRDDPDGWCEP